MLSRFRVGLLLIVRFILMIRLFGGFLVMVFVLLLFVLVVLFVVVLFVVLELSVLLYLVMSIYFSRL